MIASIDMAGVKYTIDDTTKKYVMRKMTAFCHGTHATA
jgi:hypothetical protein